MSNYIEGGDSFVYVQDEYLAAALIAVGIKLWNKNCGRFFVLADGSVLTRFHFSNTSVCGRWDTRKMIAAWDKQDEFTVKNPEHPFSVAICMAQNLQEIAKHRENANVAVFYDPDDTENDITEVSVMTGSEKMAKAEAAGLKRR